MKNLILNLFFPKFCLGCQREGNYLCEDCLALINISKNVFKPSRVLSRLYFATDYNNFIVKKLIQKFKYDPPAKDLAEVLVSLIIIYFQNLENKPEFLTRKKEFVLAPVPLYKKRLKWRGFNQAEEIAKRLSRFLKIPLSSDALIKTKATKEQTKLPEEKRRESQKGAFFCQKPNSVQGKTILLIDDVFTTGATMEEAGKILKEAGAKKVWGIVAARG